MEKILDRYKMREELFRSLPRLETERLILRKLEMGDLLDIYEFASHPMTSELTVWDRHATIRDSAAYLENVLENYRLGLMENWGIIYKEDGRLIGTCGYFYWSIRHARGELQYALSPKYWNRGLMTEAVRRIVRFGFDLMDLNRVEAKCAVQNLRSERVMQKTGMQCEGIMKEGMFAKGRFHDAKMYVILRRDYKAAQMFTE